MGTGSTSDNDDNRGLGKTARSSGLSFVGAMVSAGAGFALSVVIGRALGPGGSGIVFQMISVFTIAGAVAKLGLDTTAVWMLPRLKVDSRADIRRASALLLTGAALGGTFAGVAVYLLAPLLDASVAELTTVTKLAAFFLPIASVMTVSLAITRGLGGIRPFVLIGSIGLPLGRLAAVAVAVAFAASATAAGIAWLAVLLLAGASSLLVAMQRLRPFPAGSASTGSSTKSLNQRISTYSGPRIISSTIEQALLWLDVLIVGLIAGPVAAGIYGVVSRLVQAGSMPSTSMRIVVAPEFSVLLHRGRTGELTNMYSRTAQWIVLASMPIYVLLAILAEPVLSIFGPGFSSGALALAVMCVGATVSAATGNVQALLLMSGRSGWAALNKVIVLALSLSLLLTLVPVLGILGASIAWTLSMTLDALLASIQVFRATSIRLDLRSILLAMICAGGSTTVSAITARLAFGDTSAALVAAIAGTLVLWSAVMYLMRRRFALESALAMFTRRRPRASE